MDALAIRNSPNTIFTLEFLIQSDIRVWHKKKLKGTLQINSN
jgi:hypothetical protein